MRILIEKIEAEEINEVNNSTSLKVVGGKTQFASISVSGFTSSASAGASIMAQSYASSPFLEFSTSINALEIDGSSSSSSSVYVKSGT